MTSGQFALENLDSRASILLISFQQKSASSSEAQLVWDRNQGMMREERSDLGGPLEGDCSRQVTLMMMNQWDFTQLVSWSQCRLEADDQYLLTADIDTRIYALQGYRLPQENQFHHEKTRNSGLLR